MLRMTLGSMVLPMACCLTFGRAAMAQPATDEAGFAAPMAPTLLIVNGRIWTGVPGAADAEALAITGDAITAVGTSEDIRALAGSSTDVIDAGGRRVIPGITDSHTHFIEMGLQLSRINLRPARDRGEFISLVSAMAVRLSPGQWMLGGQFSVDSWDAPTPPHKSWIDAVTPGTPVFLNRMDGHQALANSVALKYARIDRDGPPDPPGGEIVRDPVTHEPTGILKDEAMTLVSRHIPPVDKRQMYDALLLACQVAGAWGITAVHDMTDLNQIPVYLMADRRETLSVRVRGYVQTEDFQKELSTIRAAQSEHGGLFEIAGFKSYMDGSLGSRTAYMREPFADATPQTRYPRGFKLAHSASSRYAADIRWAHDQGLQIAVHAIGDQANHDLLEVFASLPDGAARRHRVEHAQHLLPEDIARFAKLGVVASMQPFHKADDGRWAEKALGPKRALTSYAYRDLLRADAVLCFGSDAPVVTMNPYAGIAAAVSAKTLADEVWVPSQRITREEALRCYTVTPHFAAFREQRLGTLEVGRFADLAILDTDILAAPIDEIHRTEAHTTILAGRIVWRGESGPTD